MSYARIKTWIAEVLTASDLNAEFDGCLANENDLDTRLIAEIATRGTLQTAVETVTRGTLGATTEIDMGTLYAADGEAGDSYVITLTPTPAAYYTGMIISFKANTVNTGACSIDVNSLGAKSIKKNYDQSPANGDIQAGQIVTLIYDGTYFQMQSQVGHIPTLRGHFAGLQMSNDTDTEHDIRVAVGEAADSTGLIKLKLSTVITKQIDATWAVGDDDGGMNDAEHPVSGGPDCFHVFLLGTDSGGSVDVGFDTSLTAANLRADTAVIAAGLTKYRRIGSVLVDVDENIINFSQEGDEFLWEDPPLDIDTTQGATAASHALSVPTDIKVRANINVMTNSAANLALLYVSSLDANDEVPNDTVSPLGSVKVHVLTNEAHSNLIVRTNTAGEVRARGTHASMSLKIATLGYIDRRGKDD